MHFRLHSIHVVSNMDAGNICCCRCRRWQEHMKIGAKLSSAERRLIDDAFDRMGPGSGKDACSEALRRYRLTLVCFIRGHIKRCSKWEAKLRSLPSPVSPVLCTGQ
jgi:hypothetical protein